MQITVARQEKTPNSTPSLIAIDGVQAFYGLEPVDCIPAGTYSVAVSFSPRLTALAPEILKNYFGERIYTPHVQNVPNRTEIEIHFGNWPKNTDGCLLAGQTHAVDYVGQSDVAFISLMVKLRDIAIVTKDANGNDVWTFTEPVTITYIDPPEIGAT